MRKPAPTSPPAVRAGDVVIASVLLFVFVVGYLDARGWPFRAALFPRLLSVAGVAFAVLTLISFGVRTYLGRRAPARAPAEPAGDARDGTADDDVPVGGIDYVFGTAGVRAWAAALAWIAVFFCSLWLLGLLVTVPLFAVAYLRVAGGVGWFGSVMYAAVSGGVLWLVFSQLLTVPMPTGIF